MTDTPRPEAQVPAGLPGMPDDDLVLAMPSGPSPEDPAGISDLAYAVHTDRLASTRALHGGLGPFPQAGGLDLFRAALGLTGSLKVPEALRRLVESACAVTGAAWGTIAVQGRTDAVPLTSGPATASPDELDSLLVGALPAAPEDSSVLICNDLSVAAAFTGPIEDEVAGSILSAPLRVHGRVYGRIYLCDKTDGFDESDTAMVLALAEAAGVAVENARLYRHARDREQWMALAQELTSMLLSGAEADDALTLIARRVREVAHADTSVLILPSVGDTWICEIADGAHAADLIGTLFPPQGRAMTALKRQTGIIESSLTEAWRHGELRLPALSRFGPALYVPMVHRGSGVGVMLLLREPGAAHFTRHDLEVAELFASHATMAFELADAQHAEEMAALLDERARIGRDLHDLAIQQLFATGMQITAARDRLAEVEDGSRPEVGAARAALEASLAAVDDSVRQIRSIVRSLRDRDEEVSLVERLRREASLARTSLGYAPSLVLSVDGHVLSRAGRDVADELIDAVEAAVDPGIADDVVAVVREALSNVARHARASSVTVEIAFEGVLAAGVIHSSAPGTAREEPAPRPCVEIVCCDDGVGVDPQVQRWSGTANMADRARRHGGRFTIGPAPACDSGTSGTRLTWRVPLDDPGRTRPPARPRPR